MSWTLFTRFKYKDHFSLNGTEVNFFEQTQNQISLQFNMSVLKNKVAVIMKRFSSLSSHESSQLDLYPKYCLLPL